MTDATLAELERLADAATLGPWFRVEPPWLSPDVTTYVIAGNNDPHAGRPVCDFGIVEDGDDANDWNDAEFIAASRAAVPALVAEVRRLRAELAAGRTPPGGG